MTQTTTTRINAAIEALPATVAVGLLVLQGWPMMAAVAWSLASGLSAVAWSVVGTVAGILG